MEIEGGRWMDEDSVNYNINFSLEHYNYIALILRIFV